MFIRNAWYIATWADEIRDIPFARRILGEAIVLFRDSAGKIGALEDRCCHRGYPLALGEVVGGSIQCGYHGLEFDITGRCVRIPGQPNVPPGFRVRSYPVAEQDAMIWIWMGDPARADAATIPGFPYNNDWPSRKMTSHARFNYRRIVENLMDLSHFAFLHKSTVGGSVDAHVNAKMSVTETARGVKFMRWLLDAPPPPLYLKALPFKGNVDRWLEMEFVAPSACLQYTGGIDAGTGAYDQGRRDGGFALRMLHGVTPETEHSCFYFFSLCTGFRHDDPSMVERIFTETQTTIREDVVALEAQDARLRETGEARLHAIRSDAARLQADKAFDRLHKEEAAMQAGA